MNTAFWTGKLTSGSSSAENDSITYQQPIISGSGLYNEYEASRKAKYPDKSELVAIIIACGNCKKQITLLKGTFEFAVEEVRFASCSQLIESRILVDSGIRCPYCTNVIRDSIVVRDDLDLEDE